MPDFSLLADSELLRSLGVALPPRTESLRRRATSTSAAVAVVGLFSRGKSTLFNTIVGAPVAETGSLPTTKLMTEATTGQRFAAAYWGDRSQQLPLEPDAFTRAIGALGTPYPERVEISGPFRLPPGMRLVDTPGAGSVSTLDERDWYLSGAGAAVLVLAMPPGPQGEDWRLLDALDEVFPGATAILLKATSGDVDEEDLATVRARAEANCGRPVVAVPQSLPSAAWGDDPQWREVETLLADLEAHARRSNVDAAKQLRSWLDTTFASLTLDALDDRGRAMAAADSLLTPGTSPSAAEALDRLRADVRAIHLRAERSAEDLQQRRSALLAPRRALGDQLIRDNAGWKRTPYEQLRANTDALDAFLERLERWRAGQPEPELADLEHAVEVAYQLWSDHRCALVADDLLERGRDLSRPRRIAPTDAHRLVSTWVGEAWSWFESANSGPSSRQRVAELEAVLRRITG